MMPDSLRVFMWSGPRNLSTAMMYSFAQRRDTRVVDEPLYAHYLATTGALHPGREAVLATQDNDGRAVLARLLDARPDRPVLFAKMMAHHLVGLDPAALTRARNFFLIRDPRAMLVSLARVLGDIGLRDTALDTQVGLVRVLEARGQPVVCVEAGELLRDSRGVLGGLCARLGLDFDEAMLSWPAGPRPEDGVWAPHWYSGVHRSTGFGPWRRPPRDVPERLQPLLATCLPLYDFLLERAIHAPDEAGR